MSVKFTRVCYNDLNRRQKENFNFQKVASCFAEYGFNCLKLSDDWQGADFIACHINGNDFLKIQLKGRLTFEQKYRDKNIYIAFLDGNDCFVYPHDIVWEIIQDKRKHKFQDRSWPTVPKWARAILADYKL